MLDPNKTVGELSVALPHATRVFESLGIDYCCGGKRTLVEACDAAGKSVGDVIAELERTEESTPGGRVTVDDDLVDIVDHLLGVHHTFTRTELDRLQALGTRVRNAHGANHPELHTVHDLIAALAEDLEGHMLKEERVLFPYVVGLEETAEGAPMPSAPFGAIENPISVMTQEHEHVRDLLRALRQATGDLKVPEDGCASYRALFDGLAGLEKDLHEHIHLENNLLFPRAAALEARLRKRHA